MNRARALSQKLTSFVPGNNAPASSASGRKKVGFDDAGNNVSSYDVETAATSTGSKEGAASATSPINFRTARPRSSSLKQKAGESGGSGSTLSSPPPSFDKFHTDPSTLFTATSTDGFDEYENNSFFAEGMEVSEPNFEHREFLREQEVNQEVDGSTGRGENKGSHPGGSVEATEASNVQPKEGPQESLPNFEELDEDEANLLRQAFEYESQYHEDKSQETISLQNRIGQDQHEQRKQSRQKQQQQQSTNNSAAANQRDYNELFGESLLSRKASQDRMKEDDEVLGIGTKIETLKHMPVLSNINFNPNQISTKFSNLANRVVYFRPKVFRKSSKGSFVERVLFIVPNGTLHLCAKDSTPKRSIKLQALSAYAVENDVIVLLFDSVKIHDIVLRFDQDTSQKLPSLKSLVSIIRYFNPSASSTKGLVGGLRSLDVHLKKPSAFRAPGRIAVLSAAPGELEGEGAMGRPGSGRGSDKPSNHNRTAFLLPNPTGQKDDVLSVSSRSDRGESVDEEYQLQYQSRAFTSFRNLSSMNRDTLLDNFLDEKKPQQPKGEAAAATTKRSSQSQDATKGPISSPLNTPSSQQQENSQQDHRKMSDIELPAASHLLASTDPLQPLKNPKNARLYELTQCLANSNNRELIPEIQKVEAEIEQLKREFGLAAVGRASQNRDQSKGSANSSNAGAMESSAQRPLVKSEQFQRGIILSTLICQICKESQIRNSVAATGRGLPQKELNLDRKLKPAKNTICFI